MALAAPWIKLVGAYIAKFPKEMLDKLQHDEAQSQRIYEIEQSEKEESVEAKLEATREQRKIDAAKRLEEAKNIDNDVEKELVEDREQKAKLEIEKQGEIPEIDKAKKIALALNKDARKMLELTSLDPSGSIRLKNHGSFAQVNVGVKSYKEDGRKRYLELYAGIQELIVLELLAGSPHEAHMTLLGYQVMEKLRKS